MFVTTLHYQISMGVWLLIPRYFSSQHALIPYPMFIDFARNFNPIRQNLSNISFSDMFAFKMHQKGVLNGWKLLNFMKTNQSFVKKVHPVRLSCLTCSLILKRFPTTSTIPYHTFIDLKVYFHPIPLFHTLRLFDRTKYPPPSLKLTSGLIMLSSL